MELSDRSASAHPSSERRLWGTGQTWGGKRPELEGGCKHVCPGFNL